MRRVATAAASRLLRLPRHAARCPLRAACLPASAAPGAALLRVRIPRVPGEACDALEDALLGAGALSTSVADAQAGTSDETPFFHTAGEPVAPTWRWRSVELTALFSDAAAWEEAVPSARSAFPGLDESRIELSPALDADWEAAIRATFVPLRVSDTLWVVPDWDEPPSAAATNVRLTPGLAFGTGEHATTRLCLRWLQETLRGGETLLDYGCGVFLSTAALRLFSRLTLPPQALACSPAAACCWARRAPRAATQTQSPSPPRAPTRR